MLREEIRSLSANKQQLRSFGLTLGIALTVIAGILYWRDISWAIAVAGLGILLIIIGLIIPQVLRLLYKPWMSLAIILGFVMTRVLLTIIFVILFIPTGLLMKLFGRDPLRRKLRPHAKTYWIPKEYDAMSSERLERYY
ncbi:MAG: SxtJ family membrane protein [Bacteroidetes bacterium]|nr:SxtJ family membrane protein [Bacteroidota bacterium]MCY4232137.1 SxtJ family membrane protein [Bacteroidota bacterium]